MYILLHFLTSYYNVFIRFFCPPLSLLVFLTLILCLVHEDPSLIPHPLPPLSPLPPLPPLFPSLSLLSLLRLTVTWTVAISLATLRCMWQQARVEVQWSLSLLPLVSTQYSMYY